jgi:Zn-finger nucleic acid-binding protein
MKKISVGQEPEILLDVCRRGDGLWFDGGELNLLVGQLAGKAVGKTTPRQEIFTFLQDVFKTGE